MPLISQCVCGSADFELLIRHDLNMAECRRCRVMHQVVNMADEAELSRWYATRYHAGVYSHSYEHDLEVAFRRLDVYGRDLLPPVLDVGCGNGAFVAACRANGSVALGQDLGGDGVDLKVPLAKVSSRYRSITMHDVLEHVPDPVTTLGTVHRLLLPGGHLIIDFPEFFAPAGLHHWKQIEHIWMLSEGQLEALIEHAGFRIFRSYKPVPGKIVFMARR